MYLYNNSVCVGVFVSVCVCVCVCASVCLYTLCVCVCVCVLDQTGTSYLGVQTVIPGGRRVPGGRSVSKGPCPDRPGPQGRVEET